MKKPLKLSRAMSERRVHSMFDAIPLGIKILDLEGRIVDTNPAFRELIGYAEEEVTGRHFHAFLHPGEMAKALDLIRDAKAGGASGFRFEHRFLHKNGSTVWVNTFFTVVSATDDRPDPAFVIGFVDNITEHKRHELEMSELKRRLQNSLELESLRLARELHDNPMQILYSASYRLVDLSAKADPEQKEGLNQVRGLIQMVLQDLRATANDLRPPTLSTFGLENAIRSHVHNFQEKHPQIKVSHSLAHDRQMIPEQVRVALFRVVQQSLANVARHAEASEVHIHFRFDAEEAYLEIADNGKGFPMPFNRIESVRAGRYGLAGLVERLALLGGTLTVESQIGKSTVVRAMVPLEQFEDGAEEARGLKHA